MSQIFLDLVFILNSIWLYKPKEVVLLKKKKQRRDNRDEIEKSPLDKF